MKRIFNKIAVAVLVLAIYTAFTGFATELTIISGLIVSLALAVALEQKFVKRELRLDDLVRLLHLFKYMLYLVNVELKEHIEMVKIVFKKRVHLEPKVVKVPFSLESSHSIALLALTITNTPGTIALHIDRDKKIMYVHWLTPKSENQEEVKRIIIGDFEKVIKRMLE